MDRSPDESSPIVFVVDAMILFLVLFVLTPIAFIASVCLRPILGPAKASDIGTQGASRDVTVRRAA